MTTVKAYILIDFGQYQHPGECKWESSSMVSEEPVGVVDTESGDVLSVPADAVFKCPYDCEVVYQYGEMDKSGCELMSEPSYPVVEPFNG